MMDLKPALALPKGFLLVGLEKSDEILNSHSCLNPTVSLLSAVWASLDL